MNPKLLGHEKKYLRFRIVHEEAKNVSSHTESAGWTATQTTTKWNRNLNPFYWCLARPDAGKKEFTAKCKYCETLLSIELKSLELINTQREKSRKIKIPGIILLICALPCLIFSSINMVNEIESDVIYIIFIAGTIFLIAGIPLLINAYEWKKGYEHMLKTGIVDSEQHRPFNGHYLDKIESRSDRPWSERD